MLHPCSTMPVNIMRRLLPDSQCVAANERDVGMQPSLILQQYQGQLAQNSRLFAQRTVRPLGPKLIRSPSPLQLGQERGGGGGGGGAIPIDTWNPLC